MPGAHVEDGGLNQHTLFGTTEIGCKELGKRAAVLGLLDAVSTGDDGQAIFIQQGCQPSGDGE
jgi:hypothetical protein